MAIATVEKDILFSLCQHVAGTTHSWKHQTKHKDLSDLREIRAQNKILDLFEEDLLCDLRERVRFRSTAGIQFPP